MNINEIIDKTKNQKDFIGFVTQDDKNVLIVTNAYKKGDNTVFSVECSVCSKDKELFPEKEMLISKNNLKKGKKPCKCSSRWKPSLYQYSVLSKRCANEKGDVLKEVREDGTIKVYTEKYGYWEVLACDYIKGKRGSIETNYKRREKLRNPEQSHIDKFLATGAFVEGTYFWRSDRVDTRGYSVYWKYCCPVCSNDEYVKNKLCNGVFEAAGSTLKKGNRACRCSITYRWTKQQREYQLKNICTEEGLLFLGWKEKYTGAFTKFLWECSHGHKNNTEISNFIHLRHRCSVCAKNLWGFYKEKADDPDSLYLLRFHNDQEVFYKIGRTFKKQDRFAYFKKYYNMDIISIVEGTHSVVFNKEKLLKTLLRSNIYNPNITFYGSTEECFTPAILDVHETISIFNLNGKQDQNSN